jgi:hypothetical protein
MTMAEVEMTISPLLVASLLVSGSGSSSQTAEPLKVFFSLNVPDETTREAWLGHRLDRTALAEWAKGLEESIVQGTAPFVPVDKRDAADVVVEIRRCHIGDEGEFVMGGVVDPEGRAAAFELNLIYTPAALRMSISSFPRILRRVLESN